MKPSGPAGAMVFDTAFGPCVLAWTETGVRELHLPDPAEDLRKMGPAPTAGGGRSGAPVSPEGPEDLPLVDPRRAPAWVKRLARRIEGHLAGDLEDFHDVPVDWPEKSTDFERAVWAFVRELPPGATITYGEVAEEIGRPGAARAVGSAMKRTPVSLIVPAHRVVAAGRRIGGWTGPGGLTTKVRLLALEGIELSAAKSVALVLACCLGLSACATPTPTVVDDPPTTHEGDVEVCTPSEALDELTSRYWAAEMVHSPTWATWVGDRRYDDRLPDPSDAANVAWMKKLVAFRDEALAVGTEDLGPEERVTRAHFLATLNQAIDGELCREHLWSVDQLYGPQVWLPNLANAHSLRDARDVKTLTARYAAIPAYLAAHTANLQAGLAEGLVAPKLAVERVVPQLDALAEGEVVTTPFIEALRWPEGWDEATRAPHRAALAELVETEVRPAFAAYRTFLAETLLPQAREKVGVDALPGGAACYASRIRRYAGPGLTAEAIHETGKRELERLFAEMDAIAKVEGEAGGRQAFVDALESREDQFAASAHALLAAADASVRRAEAALPKLFGHLPKTPIEVKAIEAFRAPQAPAAYYYGAPDDGSRPGYFYVNTHDLKSRPLYNMDALAFHEAVPGHHLQIALAKELTDVPDFQRHSGQTAFVEGWALYAERLADEVGLYQTPLTRFGHLGYQAWRAARLVVDTGLHSMGWTRQQAIDFLEASAPLTRTEAEAEIDRYIIWPGQALAYMLGRMHIESLRAKAEAALGERFDLKAFHDEVLRYGAVPLEVLDGIVAAWIDGQGGGENPEAEVR